ncbi:MAG TPA: hypothetical protein VGZ93_04890 [Candidatus Methylacidiphilales bacterium]|jgi:hypothetical protein|nr:hypothetical protein [Candidatus Methylacidiphilales bacterium]
MKIHLSALVFITGSLLLPLRAQPAPDTSTPDAMTPDDASGVQNVPSPPRNIMPLSVNHKPNPTNPPPEIAGPIDKFFKGLEAGDYANSYETFLSGSRLGAQKEKMSAMISKTEEAFGVFGKFRDYEIFDNYSIGSNVIVLTYLSRHDIQPIRWRFIYYRPDKTWGVINMGFDVSMLDTLD